MAPRPRARPGGSASDAAIATSPKASAAAWMGGCSLLSPGDPGGRRYLRLAANEGWPDLVLGWRLPTVRRRCCTAYNASKASLSPWQCGTQLTSQRDGGSQP